MTFRPINLDSLEGNALESIIGAIYLDGGFYKAKKAVLKIIVSHYGDLASVLKEEIDFKSNFIFGAKEIDFHWSIDCKRKKKRRKWVHLAEVYIDNKPYGKGKGQQKSLQNNKHQKKL